MSSNGTSPQTATAEPILANRNPTVSVLIPVYNGSEFLKEAIDSALAQTYPHVEVVIIDDGSTDDSAQIVAQYGDKIKYIYQQNAGTSAARNTGIAGSTGELIALLDQDDRWLPRKLEEQVPRFFEQPNVGLVHTGIRVFMSDDGRVTSEVLAPEVLDVHDLKRWCLITCASTVFPRKVIEHVGNFDATLPGADDWDMWIRIARHYKVVGCRDILTEIRQHPGNQGKNADRMYPIIEGVIKKHRIVHENCTLCEQAHVKAIKKLHEDYYVKTSLRAKEAFNEGQYAKALGLRVRGFLRNPVAVARYPKRIVERLFPGLANDEATS